MSFPKLFRTIKKNDRIEIRCLGFKILSRTLLKKKLIRMESQNKRLSSSSDFIKRTLVDDIFFRNMVKYDPSKKIKIYFLFNSHAFWPSWESFFHACKEDSRIETKLIYYPVPEQTAGYTGQFENVVEWLNENAFEYTHIDDMDLYHDTPHVMILQSPYPNKYYSQDNIFSLKKLGIRTIYISYGLEFTEAPDNIKNHFRLDVQKNAWRVYVFSRDLLADYKKYCPAGNRHVRCLGHPKFDALFNSQKKAMPLELSKKVRGRRVVVWHVHFPCYYSVKDGKLTLSTFDWDQDQEILNILKKANDLFFIFLPHHMFFGVFQVKFGVSEEDIANFKSSLENGENSTIWFGDYPEVLSWADAIIGERSAVTMESIATGKPVLYVEKTPECYNKFGLKAVESCYYASTVEEVKNFIEMFEKGEDTKKPLRKAFVDEYIVPYFDGKCGERIKNDVVNSVISGDR